MKVTRFIQKSANGESITTSVVFETENMRDEGYIDGILITALSHGDLQVSDITDCEQD